MTRSVASFAAVLSFAGIAIAADPPRYKFEPGQQLAFRTTYTFKYIFEERTGELANQSDWTVWVIRPIKDGSYRLVIKQEERIAQTSTTGTKRERPVHTRLIYADIFPDGRIVPNDTITIQVRLEDIFPRLPKDVAEAARGWSYENNHGKITARPAKSDKGFRFETVTESPENAVFLATHTGTSTIDPDLGRLAAGKYTTTQGYAGNGKGTGTIELIEARATDPTLHKQLAEEEVKFFESLTAYNTALSAVGKAGEEQARKQLEAAIVALKSVKVTNPMLKAELEQRIKGHEQEAKYRLEKVERRAKIVGKSAAAFETTDIDGKAFKLADLKGKVVVLDFWYRGCGWCIKAMPQLNGLADDFAGKPVAILGMNTDEKEKDARFVIEKMGLKYPTLKATGLLEKFGVQGAPTLIVIDQQGKIHDFHVGYTATLRADVGRQIAALLDKK